MSENEEQATIDPSTIVTLELIDSVAKTVMYLIRWGAIGVCAYFGYLSITSLAGRKTDAQISVIIQYLSDSGLVPVVVISLIVAVVGTIYGYLQRRLRHRVIREFARYRKMVEPLVDPNRSSSGLTEIGETNPDDE